MASSYKQHFVGIEPKGLHYHGDGTGRDGYVLKFNGGLFSQQMIKDIAPKPAPTYNSLQFSTKSVSRRNPPRLDQKINHYQPDGSGRDTYVSINEGGNTVNYNIKRKEDDIFSNSLRSYYKSTSDSRNSTSYGALSYKTATFKENQRRFSQQTQQSFRLSQNKPILEPPERNFSPRCSLNSNKFSKTHLFSPFSSKGQKYKQPFNYDNLYNPPQKLKTEPNQEGKYRYVNGREFIGDSTKSFKRLVLDKEVSVQKRDFIVNPENPNKKTYKIKVAPNKQASSSSYGSEKGFKIARNIHTEQ